MPVIFRAPYDAMTASELLRHFRDRQGVHYFPVLDEEQTDRTLVDAVLANRFNFNGECHQLTEDFDWCVNPSDDIEWLILLHKFYFAAGLGRAYEETGDPRYVEKWLALTRAWMDNVPLNFLPSDVAGRRIQNWIFAHYYFVRPDSSFALPADFYRDFLHSLGAQVNYLCDHLTPARNHRTLELAAVFLAAVVFPEFAHAQRWLDLAKAELAANIQSDMLPDGVHCELSTDYHHLVLKNYLWVRRLADANSVALPGIVDTMIRRALTFSLHVHRPDGAIPSLSDGDSRNFRELLQQGYELYGDPTLLYGASGGRQGSPPPQRSMAFRQGGYCTIRSGWGNGDEPYSDERYLVFDCGPLGRGNHGHFDLLNFEIAAYGQALIVDPGRYTYDESGETNWRVRFRSTAYHNTVEVDGKNQTRYEFRTGKYKISGPEPGAELRWREGGEDFDFLCGVARSSEYDAVHERRIFFHCPDYWIISDVLHATTIHDYRLRFHLTENANQRVSEACVDGTAYLDAPNLILAQPLGGNAAVSVDDGFISRSYGTKHSAPIVRFSCRGEDQSFHTVLFPYKRDKPAITVERLPVWRGKVRCEDADTVALRIAVTTGAQAFVDYYFSAAVGSSETYSFGPFTYSGWLFFNRAVAEESCADIRLPSNGVLSDRRAALRQVGS